MTKPSRIDINQLLLQVHKLSAERAVDTAIRTGTSLIEYRNGKIVKVKPKFKYVLVPIKTPKKKKTPASLRKKTG
jgi:hypothetical protein